MMQKIDKGEIRRDILKLVADYHAASSGEKIFRPGAPIPVAGRVYDHEELELLVSASLDFWLTAGEYASKFEKEFSEYTGIKHSLLVNSGSSANLLAISSLMSVKLGDRRLRSGDEVITVAAGFPTTVSPIIQNNLVPVFVDVSLPSYNADAEQIERAVTGRTKAIMLAHTLGNPFNLEKVRAIAVRHGLWLVEDCCDALGSLYGGRMAGRFGDIATFSFYPAHHITMGEGGCVSTDSDDLKMILRSLRDWGRDCWCDPGSDNTCKKRFDGRFGGLPQGYDHKYVYSHFGFNLKATEMQAAIGLAQLKKLPSFIESRKQNWRALREGLSGMSEYFVLPEPEPGSDPSWFGFLLTVKENAGFKREEIVRYLESKGIQTRMLFAGNMVWQPCFDGMRKEGRGYRTAGDLTVTDTIMNDTFWIGVYPGLDAEKTAYMIGQIKAFTEGARTKG
jgi:CDP-6-deoxy-D-xylo-4-hexulose-3-dehydrase